MTKFDVSRAVLVAVLLLAPTAQAAAQDGVTAPSETATDDQIGEIIVTAQKRETALQDVPFSVAAASEAQIRNSGASNIVDLSRNFAGLTITDLGPGQSQVAIRGISAGQVVRDQPGVKESVGVYLDESAISVALSVREWAIRQGWGGRPVDHKAAAGILIAALGVLAAHLGYSGAKRAS
jgi:outer membrane receptor protein involved in Fe transport